MNSNTFTIASVMDSSSPPVMSEEITKTCVGLVDDVYRDLVIQVKKVGLNINQIIRDIRYGRYFTDEQILKLELLLEDLKKYLKEEKKEIKSSVRYIEKNSPLTLKRIIEKNSSEIADRMCKKNLFELLTKEILDFIDLLEKKNWPKMYVDYIYTFVSNMNLEEYAYNELELFLLAVEEEISRVNQKMLNPESLLTNEDFKSIRNIINKYRK